MKKILALILCVVMLASISVSAFAAVDLSPAYTAMNNLYNAYGNLAGAVTYANATVGIRVLRNDPTWSGLNPGNFLNGAVSYEGLWSLVAPDIYSAYDAAGAVVVQNVNQLTQDLVANIQTAINSFFHI